MNEKMPTGKSNHNFFASTSFFNRKKALESARCQLSNAFFPIEKRPLALKIMNRSSRQLPWARYAIVNRRDRKNMDFFPRAPRKCGNASPFSWHFHEKPEKKHYKITQNFRPPMGPKELTREGLFSWKSVDGKSLICCSSSSGRSIGNQVKHVNSRLLLYL